MTQLRHTLRRALRRRGLALFVSQIAVVLLAQRIVAAADEEPRDVERQTREFDVSVDGGGRGTVTMELHHRSDGSDLMRGEATTSIKLLLYKYTYTSAGSETWNNGRLMEMDNVADFNGKRFAVKALATARGLKVTTDDAASLLPRDTWSTSYWQIPERLALAANAAAMDPATRDGWPVTLLDGDKGRVLEGKLKWIGEETLALAGAQRACTHYQIAGEHLQVNLWYDASRRLVRQEAVESRHKVRLELKRIAQ